MKCKVPIAEAINDEAVRPERVQEALGQLLGVAARDGLLALPVEVGLGVLRELLEAEVASRTKQLRWARRRTARPQCRTRSRRRHSRGANAVGHAYRLLLAWSPRLTSTSETWRPQPSTVQAREVPRNQPRRSNRTRK